MSTAYDIWKLAFEKSPIILTGGIAQSIPGGMLPIIVFTEAINFTKGLLSGGSPLDLDKFFATFMPLPGATLIDQQLGRYPFANQATAANATIAQPLTISMRMICPVKDDFGYPLKLATMMALKATLEQHNGSGGTYTVATGTNFYPNCILLRMSDVSPTGESNQTQYIWQFDFEQPLLTLQSAQKAQNSLMSKIADGTKVTPGADGAISWSGLGQTVGQASSVVSSSVIPASSGAAGAGVAGVTAAFGGVTQ